MSLIALAARLAIEDPPADIPPEKEVPLEAPGESEEMFPEKFEGVLEPLEAIQYVVKYGIRSSEWAEAALYGIVTDILGGMRTDKASLDHALEGASNN